LTDSFKGIVLKTKLLALVAALAVLLSTGLSANAAPSEPAYQAINAQSVWDQGFTGEGTTVAIIDQGVNLNHPYFVGQIIDGYCFVEATSSFRCPNGSLEQSGVEAASQRKIGSQFSTEDHGNMVAGIVAGNPTNEAPGGIAPGSDILMANVDLTLSGILAGLRYVDQRKEELNIVALSMSWGGYFTEIPREWLRCDTNPELQQMAAVLSSLRKGGVIPFASAGNTPTLDIATSLFPSCLKDAVAVGSVNQANDVSWYVTMSDKVEIVAPDYTISANTFSYARSSGTSAAAPLVAGSYALLRQAFPNHGAEQVLSAIKASGKPINDVIRKNIPMVDLRAAYLLLSNTAAGAVIAPQASAGQVLNVGTFNGKIVVYAKGYKGQTLSWRIAGKWQKVTVTKDYQAFDRLTSATGLTVTIDLYLDGVTPAAFSKTVITK
jgi:subtilisin family serine protease|tara:strand:+ start:6845 stop:8152 length:1308 start_codon:yes stop_codon:yes gene_type:complete